MLDIKKLLTKMLETKTVTFTRTNNNYVNATNFARISAVTRGGIGMLTFNCQMSTSMPTGTGLTQIGTMSPAPKYEILQTVPCQNNNATILLQITTAGVINIGNTSGTATGTNFCRAMVPFLV